MPRAILSAVLMLAVFAPAAMGALPPAGPRIVNGSLADEGEYPSQGLLLIDTADGQAVCGGSVVAARKFLTAAHCVIGEDGRPRPPAAFAAYLGETHITLNPAHRHTFSAVAVHPDYAEDAGGQTNDVAVLTFASPVTTPALDVVSPDDGALWAPGRFLWIIGWGDTFEGSNDGSADLREADIPVRTDADCAEAYGGLFVAATMVCAGDADPLGRSADTCQGDSGGPLLAGLPPFVAAGVVSWGNGCNREGFPGVYSRIGAQPLNAWVRGRINDVDFTVAPAAALAGDTVTFTATSPAGGNPDWDFDNDGTFDASGASVAQTYPAGEFEVVMRKTDPSGEPADQRREFVVAPRPAPPTPPPTPPTIPAPPPLVGGPAARLATILVFGKPQVRHGRFRIRLNFAATAPPGIALIEVFRGRRKIGGARTGVRRGGSRQVVVKLTKTGRRLLRQSAKKRLKVKVQVRVKGLVLRSKTVTIRQ